MKNADSLVTQPAVASGAYSIVLGAGACGLGNSVAIGYKACSGPGDRGVAIGYESKSCSSSVAIGNGPLTTQNDSIAISTLAKACGYAGVALGAVSLANGNCSISIGIYNCAYSAHSISIGCGAKVCATATNGISIGCVSLSNGDNAIAIGRSAAASGSVSISIGNFSQATGSGAISIQSTASGLGNGATGNYSIAIGAGANRGQASGTKSINIGGISNEYTPSKSLCEDSIVLGANSCSCQIGAIAIGGGVTANISNTLSTKALELQTSSETGGIIMYSGTYSYRVYVDVDGNLCTAAV